MATFDGDDLGTSGWQGEWTHTDRTEASMDLLDAIGGEMRVRDEQSRTIQNSPSGGGQRTPDLHAVEEHAIRPAQRPGDELLDVSNRQVCVEHPVAAATCLRRGQPGSKPETIGGGRLETTVLSRVQQREQARILSPPLTHDLPGQA
jgi:hypothetical protein